MESTTPTAASTPSNGPQIRYSGRMHVRGKIRRVWRPRFLELWDNGLVRYFEDSSSSSSSSNFVTNQSEGHNAKRQYTLAIFHARILDVTTFRDMHVGLPASCYGFVFRGQRLMHLEESGEFREQRDFLCAVTSLEQAQMWVVALQWAAHELQQRTHGLGAQLSMIEPWWKEMNTNIPTPRSFTTQQQHQHQHHETPRAREHAVAAVPKSEPVLRLRPQQRQPSTHEGTDSEEDHMLGVEILESCNSSLESTTTSPKTTERKQRQPAQPSSEPLQQQQQQQQQQPGHQHPPRSLAVSTTALSPVTPKSPVSAKIGNNSTVTMSSSLSEPPAFGASPFRPRRPVKKHQLILVTKVVQYRVLLLQWHELAVAFEIHVLAVYAQQQQKQQPPAEQWSILRTGTDLQQLVAQLSQEVGPAVVDQALGGRRQREAVVNLALSNSTGNNKTNEAARVDRIIRNLVLNGQVVNAVALKEFLGFHSTQQRQQPRSLSMRFLWPHDSRSILQPRQPVLIPGNQNLDQFVREWLQVRSKVPQSKLDEQALTLLQKSKKANWCVAAAATAAVAVPMVTSGNRYIPSVSVRLDLLVLSWAGAAYLGYQWNKREKDKHSVQLYEKQRRTTAKVITTDRSDVELMDSRRKEDSESGVILRGESEHLDIEESDEESEDEAPGLMNDLVDTQYLPSPLPQYPENGGSSCWSQPNVNIFHVRGANYLSDKIKIPSGPCPLTCRGVDVWMADTAERHIARHPSVLGGKLKEEDTFLVNFLLPFGNLVAYFSIPPLEKFPPKLRQVWSRFLKGDQEYRDKRLKLLPVVAKGPWIVKAAVGPGNAPAVLGKVIPLQYFFRDPAPGRKGVYEVDVIITASTIAKGILSVVKGHTKSVSIAFAFIIEGTRDDELPENVLCCFQLHTLHLEDCPLLPVCRLDDEETD